MCYDLWRIQLFWNDEWRNVRSTYSLEVHMDPGNYEDTDE